MPKGLHEMTVDELRRALTIRTFELNLIVRGLDLHGIRVDVDLVERTNEAHPDGYTEIILSARDVTG
jgi:hypothetical protein